MQRILEKRQSEAEMKEVIELTSEVKIGVVSFKNQPKGTSPMAIIASRPQGMNETSSFANDMCKGARLLIRDIECVRFTNFAIDGVSVETHDVLLALCKFLNGKINYCTVVDNKHNVKNHR